MKSTRILTLALAAVGAALVVAVAPVTGATLRPSGMTAAELHAIVVRSEALNTMYGNAVTRLTPAQFAAVYTNGGAGIDPQELAATVARGVGLDRRYGGTVVGTTTAAERAAQHARDVGMNRLARSGVLTQPSTVPSGGEGFHWTDFGIGAGGMLGLMLIAVGLLVRVGPLVQKARAS